MDTQLPRLGQLRADVVTVAIGGNDVRAYDSARFATDVERLTDFAADWFHPSDRGHGVWADAFWNELKDSPALSSGPYPAAWDVGRR